MLEKLIKREFYLERHRNAPLLYSRGRFLSPRTFPWQGLLEQFSLYKLEEKGLSKKTIAHNHYLLKEFLGEVNSVLSDLSELTPQIIDKVEVWL